jgi:hypothetical protein
MEAELMPPPPPVLLADRRSSNSAIPDPRYMPFTFLANSNTRHMFLALVPICGS